MKIDWSEITPSEFERLCYHLLEFNGFTDLKWYGEKGSDRGRDIVAKKIDRVLPSAERQKKLVAQCKRYTTSQPRKSELKDDLAKAVEHKPDYVLFCISISLSSSLHDWFASIDKSNDYNFHIIVWDANDLQREVRQHRNKLYDEFPALFKRGEPIVFYPTNRAEMVVMCNEVEEVGFYIMNSSSIGDATPKIEQFIAFIRENELHFE